MVVGGRATNPHNICSFQPPTKGVGGGVRVGVGESCERVRLGEEIGGRGGGWGGVDQ